MSAARPAAKTFRCSLCGHRFSEGADSHCNACPLHRGECGLVQCPECGFEFPVGSKLVDWVRRIVGRKP